jgi:RNA polymerase sigma-70 factor, ECF subfamily
MVGNPLDAEDVLQETFIKAMRALPDFEGRSSVSTWLYRIAVNEALMLIRKRRPDLVSIEEPGNEDDEDQRDSLQIVDWCCLPEKELMAVETRKAMDKAAQNLSPALRAVFVLRDIQGLSVHETAEALNLSEMAVKTRLSRARLQLRQELSTYFAAERLGK